MALNQIIGIMHPGLVFLMDANTIMGAYQEYYRKGQVEGFWRLLSQLIMAGRIKMPRAIYREMRPKAGDPIIPWLRDPQRKRNLILREPVRRDLVNKVYEEVYGTTLDDKRMAKIGRDPILIAAAMADRSRVIVTKERKTDAKTAPRNRKIPDACRILEIRCISDFALFFDLMDFKF